MLCAIFAEKYGSTFGRNSMSSDLNKPSKVFWILSGLALLWNLLGASQYIAQVTITPEGLAALPDGERALYESNPAWVTASFAIAVFGGVIGSVLLLARKKAATVAFTASLVGIIVQMSYWLFFTDARAVYGAEVYIMPALVIAIAAALLMWSKKLTIRRILR